MYTNNKITFKNQNNIYSTYRFSGYFDINNYSVSVPIPDSEDNEVVLYFDYWLLNNNITDNPFVVTTRPPRLNFQNYT